jgi:hypothetical protein
MGTSISAMLNTIMIEQSSNLKQLLENGVIRGRKVEFTHPSVAELVGETADSSITELVPQLELTTPSNEEITSHNYDEATQQMVEICKIFLAYPLVEDHFGNDETARSVFEAKLKNQFGESGMLFYNENGYRPNTLRFVTDSSSLFADMAPDLYPELADTFKRIDSALTRVTYLSKQAYKGLSQEDKRLVVAAHKVAGISLLQTLAHQPVSEKNIQFIETISTQIDEQVLKQFQPHLEKDIATLKDYISSVGEDKQTYKSEVIDILKRYVTELTNDLSNIKSVLSTLKGKVHKVNTGEIADPDFQQLIHKVESNTQQLLEVLTQTQSYVNAFNKEQVRQAYPNEQDFKRRANDLTILQLNLREALTPTAS